MDDFGKWLYRFLLVLIWSVVLLLAVSCGLTIALIVVT